MTDGALLWIILSINSLSNGTCPTLRHVVEHHEATHCHISLLSPANFRFTGLDRLFTEFYFILEGSSTELSAIAATAVATTQYRRVRLLSLDPLNQCLLSYLLRSMRIYSACSRSSFPLLWNKICGFPIYPHMSTLVSRSISHGVDPMDCR